MKAITVLITFFLLAFVTLFTVYTILFWNKKSTCFYSQFCPLVQFWFRY